MDQIHVRDAETANLVREVARRTGMTMSDVVRAAVRTYATGLGQEVQDVTRLSDWQEALARDRAGLRAAPEDVDDLYGPDGLPR